MTREIAADLQALLPAPCRVSQRNGWVVIHTHDRAIPLRPDRAESLIARLPVVPSRRSIAVLTAFVSGEPAHPKRRIMHALAKLRRSSRSTQ